MGAPKIFNNIIIGQFVLTGVPIKVYVSGRFLTVTDADDIEDPTIGFGMDENGHMIQFSYPEVEFLQVNGNKIDIATYNKGMEALHSGEEVPADKEADEDTAEEEGEEEGEEEEKDAPKGPSMSDGIMPSMANLLEISADEQSAEEASIKAEEKAAALKFKASTAAYKTKVKNLKDRSKANKAQTVEEDAHAHGTSNTFKGHDYTFGTGDIINNRNPNCTHYGSKGIVIQIPQKGLVRYTVTNSGDTYKPGDILTKTKDQLEKI